MTGLPNWNEIKKAVLDVEVTALKALTGRDATVVNDLSELVNPGCRDGILSVPGTTATKEPQQR
jgi:hypothetical protein